MIKKLTAALLAVSMSIALAACGSSGTQTTTAAGGSSAAEEVKEEAKAAEESGEAYKIGIFASPLSTKEEYYRTAEMLVEQYGPEHFVMDVYPENPQEEQEVTISKVMNMAMDPDVKVIVCDSADIGTIAMINKVKEERPDIKFLLGSLNEDVYEMAKVGDMLISMDPELFGQAVAQFAVDAGAKHFVFYSFARHMSNALKVRHLENMKAVCEANGVTFEQVTMPDPMGDSGISGAQQFMLESIPSMMDKYGTKDVAYYATVSTIQECMLRTIVENGGIYPCHTDPSPFSAFAGALGLEIDDAHKYDAEYVDQLITDELAKYNMNGRVGGWEKSFVRCEFEFLVQYALAYCNGEVNEVDGKPDYDKLTELAKDIYGESAVFNKSTNDTTGEVYDNWFTISRDLYAF